MSFTWIILQTILILAKISFHYSENKFITFDILVVEIGSNIGRHVANRIIKHLNSVDNTRIVYLNHLDTSFFEIFQTTFVKKLMGKKNKVLLLSLGNTKYATEVAINETLFNSLTPESYIIKFDNLVYDNLNVFSLVSNGRPLDSHIHKNLSFDRNSIHYGAVAGAYAVLELMGYAFLHPLEPHLPDKIQININHTSFDDNWNIIEKPYWPERAFHIHTQHPLELTEVLQGHDIPQFGPIGPHCRTYRYIYLLSVLKYMLLCNDYSHKTAGNDDSSKYCERWEDMVSDVGTSVDICYNNYFITTYRLFI